MAGAFDDDDVDKDDVDDDDVAVGVVLVVAPLGLVLSFLAAAGLDARCGRSELSSLSTFARPRKAPRPSRGPDKQEVAAVAVHDR